MNGQIGAPRRIAYFLFIPAMLLFLVYVFYGYSIGIRSTFPDISLNISVILSVLAAIFIYFGVRHTGSAIVRARIRSPLSILWAVITFIALLLFSGYAFLTASMLAIEGPDILRTAAGESLDAVQKLYAFADSVLPVPEWEQLQGRVADNRRKLRATILNESIGPNGGNYCGIGDQAKRVLTDIGADIPSVVLVPGDDVDHKCYPRDQLEKLAAKYDGFIADGLKNLPILVTMRIHERAELRASAEASLGRDIKTLQAIQDMFFGVSWLLNVNAFRQSVQSIEKVNRDYTSMYRSIVSLTGVTSPELPGKLENYSLEELFSAWHIIPTIAKRLDRVETILLIILAIAADALACFVTSVAIRVHREIWTTSTNAKARLAEFPISQSREKRVRYLWSPIERV